MLKEIIKMEIFNKSKPSFSGDAAASKSTEAGKNKSASLTVVGKDANMTGSITSQGSVEILGAMDGKINSSCVTIREGGSFTGDIKCQTLNVQGRIDAQIKTESILIFSKGVVRGSISYKKIKIEDGGQINGKLNPESEESAPAAPARQRPSANGQA